MQGENSFVPASRLCAAYGCRDIAPKHMVDTLDERGPTVHKAAVDSRNRSVNSDRFGLLCPSSDPQRQRITVITLSILAIYGYIREEHSLCILH